MPTSAPSQPRAGPPGVPKLALTFVLGAAGLVWLSLSGTAPAVVVPAATSLAAEQATRYTKQRTRGKAAAAAARREEAYDLETEEELADEENAALLGYTHVSRPGMKRSKGCPVCECPATGGGAGQSGDRSRSDFVPPEGEAPPPPAAAAKAAAPAPSCPPSAAAAAALDPATAARAATSYVAQHAAEDLYLRTAVGDLQLRDDSPSGPTAWKWPAAPRPDGVFNPVRSEGRLLFDRTYTHLGLVDQYTFNSVLLKTGVNGIQVHAHGLVDVTAEEPQPPGAQAQEADMLVENRAVPPTPLLAVLEDANRATWNGVSYVPAQAPLSQCAGGGAGGGPGPHAGNGKGDPIYYFFRPSRAANIYHSVSDGMIQMWRMMVEMGNAPQRVSTGGWGGYASRRPNILIVGPLDASNEFGPEPFNGAHMFMFFAEHLFDKVLHFQDPVLQAGLCATDVRAGLGVIYQEITFTPYAEALAFGGVRAPTEVIAARAGIEYEDLSERAAQAASDAGKLSARVGGWKPKWLPNLGVDHRGEANAPALAEVDGYEYAKPPSVDDAPPVAPQPGASGLPPWLAAGRRRPPVWPPRVLLQIRRNAKVRNFREEDIEYVKAAFGHVGVPVEVVAFTEAVSPKEQCAAMARGDIIMGFHGAGLTTSIFARPGALLVQLVPSGMIPEEAMYFHRLAVLADMGYFEWQERDLEHFLQWKYGSGLPKPVVGFRNPGYDARDIRVFAISVLMAWMNSAGARYA